MRKLLLRSLIFSMSFSAFSAVQAQTIIPKRPNGQNGQTVQSQQAKQAQQRQQAQNIQQSPILPKTSIEQAKQQFEGVFPDMVRTLAGGLIQEAWDVSNSKDGVVRLSQCRDCVYKVRLREFMTTSIELPQNIIITGIDIGDGQAFNVKQRTANIIALKPNGYGMDSNLTIYTEQGHIYPFYLRAEAHNSQNIPDLLVRIGDAGTQATPIAIIPQPKPANIEAVSPIATQQAPDFMKSVIADFSDPNQPANHQNIGDYIKRADFDPERLRGFDDYELWGNKEGKKMKPDRIFRDDQFTYIQFGDAWEGIELPTAYVVIDDIDELVNTRVAGKTYIIESTRDLITLKSGQSYLCIKYEGDA